MKWKAIIAVYLVGAWLTFGHVYTTHGDEYTRSGLAFIAAYVWPLWWFGQSAIWTFDTAEQGYSE